MTNSPREWAWVCSYLNEHLRAAVTRTGNRRYVYLYAQGPVDALNRLQRALGGSVYERQGDRGIQRRWWITSGKAVDLWVRLQQHLSEETVSRIAPIVAQNATNEER